MKRPRLTWEQMVAYFGVDIYNWDVGADSERFETELNLEKLEKKAIERALKLTDGQQVSASHLLGISPRQLVYKIRKHGIKNTGYMKFGKTPKEVKP